MNRNVKTGIAVVLLLLLPLISYIYLKKGFEFQKDNFEELSSQVEVNQQVAKGIFPFDSAVAKVNVVLFIRDNQNISQYLEIINGLEEQYAKIPNFSAFIYYSDGLNIEEIEMQKVQWKSISMDEWITISEIFPLEGFTFEDGSSILLDVDNAIRNSYNLRDQASVRKMIEHASLLFPQPKRRR